MIKPEEYLCFTGSGFIIGLRLSTPSCPLLFLVNVSGDAVLGRLQRTLETNKGNFDSRGTPYRLRNTTDCQKYMAKFPSAAHEIHSELLISLFIH